MLEKGVGELLKRLQTVNRTEKGGFMPSFSFLNDENCMFVSADATTNET